MSIQGYYLLPHPPIVLPEIGKGEERKILHTSDALHTIGKEIAQKAPNTIILITPHGNMFQDAISLTYEDDIEGSMEKFGAPSLFIKLPINKALTKKIFEIATEANISVLLTTKNLLHEYNISLSLDHGAMVPLHFINQYYKDYKLVHITYAPFSDIDLYKFGIAIQKAIDALNENAVLIASGDLSHKLSNKGPYEYSPYGARFDTEFLALLEQGDITGVFQMDEKMIHNAGECGRRSIMILLGSLDERQFHGECFSYEGTFGVGYGVMKFKDISECTSRLRQLLLLSNTAYEKRQLQSDPYVRLARESLTYYITKGEELKQLPEYIPDEMKLTRSGVFVSLKKFGELRGCIGTISPVTNNIAKEIVRNAIEAGINDPRFFEVDKNELLDINISVDVLTVPEPASKENLDPKEYGVIVKSQGKTGLLLPNLEGVGTVNEQLSIALQKAGITSNEEYTIQRFKVLRHEEE